MRISFLRNSDGSAARKIAPFLNEASILLADDDPDDRLLLEMAFADLGYPFELRFVENGLRLLEYLHHRGEFAKSKPSRPGLILLDLNMPTVDGREALVVIKKCPDHKDIPIVIWTTSKEKEDRSFCLEAGASAYVTKPNSFLEMKAAIGEVINTHFQLPSEENHSNALSLAMR